ncbi:MAG: AarF/ABC1/UbiB kinase family protein [Acidobacteria bacterium]|nr:AarF/ABC1/UbiB kinase family protein [Acidobacteriota bacterium]
MLEVSKNKEIPAPDPAKPGVERDFGRHVDTGGHGLVRRFLTTGRHALGLGLGALVARVRELPKSERRRIRYLLLRPVLAVVALPVNRELKRAPVEVQLRRRLEKLGPTYIKLGQILSAREDLLPKRVTEELKNLLDKLPSVPYPIFHELVRRHLGRPVEEVFAHIRTRPLGSASIGQIHLATLIAGEQVVLKVVKPGIRRTLKRDTVLLKALGAGLQILMPRYQPRRVISEFCDYTLREVDLLREADNAETFSASFEKQTDIVFPRIYREFSNQGLLCMEYLDGIQATDPKIDELRDEDRARLVDLGSEAIISMLYRDGFFHADLHPGNLVILPGPKLGFIDLGMVGRFDSDLKHTLLYYYYSLLAGEHENAANYLSLIAHTDGKSDPVGFRRDVEDVCRHWSHRSRFSQFSLAELIMQSVSKGAKHGMYFPVEMVLMVKAIVTFEAVGKLLLPDFDVTKASRKHMNRILLERFGPLRLTQESLTALPELIDTLVKTPRLVTEGLRLMEQATRRPTENPFAGMRATLLGGFCLVAGAILAGSGGPWPLWVALLIAGFLLPIRRGR